MAIRVTSQSRTLPVYFDVSQRVGPSCPNQHEDVLLVQYLFKKTWQAFPALAPALPPSGIRADGRITIHDFYSILHYQFKTAYSNRGITLDGIISPTNHHLTTHTAQQYTIVYLNLGLMVAFPFMHDRPESEHDFPRQLLPQLSGHHHHHEQAAPIRHA